jgi:hypothetical protein
MISIQIMYPDLTWRGTAPTGAKIVFPYDHINKTSIGWYNSRYRTEKETRQI